MVMDKTDQQPSANKVAQDNNADLEKLLKQNPQQASDEDLKVIHQYTDNLTSKIRNNPDKFVTIGRDREIAAVMNTLGHVQKNNPVLVGEAGVGKTNIAEGVAKQIANYQVPDYLLGREVIELKLARLPKDNFTKELENLIEAIERSSKLWILFIDEIHMIVGAGDNDTMNAAEMLKPALARGDFMMIGATTAEEYHKYIENNRALARRMNRINVDPPTNAQTVDILRGIAPRYEQHHHVKYSDQSYQTIVNLAARYMAGRAMPDKAIDILDDAGSRLNYQRSMAIKQGKPPLSDIVTNQIVAESVHGLTNIPVKSLLKSDAKRVLELKPRLLSRVKGQTEAIDEVVKALTNSSADIQDHTRPRLSAFLMGTTGVGKTELVKTVAQTMFGDPEAMIRFDMSEYGLSNSVDKFISQATEKVHFHPYSVLLLDEIEKANDLVHNLLLQILEDGILTDKSGQTFDFRNTMIFMTTNVGAELIQSKDENTSKEHIETEGSRNQWEHMLRDNLQAHFRPEFLNRIDYKIAFNRLTKDVCRDICKLRMQEVTQRLNALGYQLIYDQPDRETGRENHEVIDYITDHGFDINDGARPLQRTINSLVLYELSDRIMQLRAANDTSVLGFKLAIKDDYDKLQYQDSMIDTRKLVVYKITG